MEREGPTRGTPGSSRRRFLQVGGVAAAGVVLAGCSGKGSRPSAVTSEQTTRGHAMTTDPDTDAEAAADLELPPLVEADFAGLGTCVLIPEQTPGPFALEEQFDRRDITEDRQGHPLRLGLRVVDEDCLPVQGAAVEVWHADASGDYSAFDDGSSADRDAGPGTTFLRGTQVADPEGIVEFWTIFPGWYPGRALHIHLRVHQADRLVLTSQFYFDEAYAEPIMASRPYRGTPDTSNERDGIAGDPERDGTMLHTVTGPTAGGPGTVGLLNLGVATDAA